MKSCGGAAEVSDEERTERQQDRPEMLLWLMRRSPVRCNRIALFIRPQSAGCA